ncbi:hypothetical protein CAPTEDRAFT_118886, partial [Capitella teleta]
IGLGLHNYCRNPNNAEQPWCYTDKDSCETNFCDVSGIRKISKASQGHQILIILLQRNVMMLFLLVRR